MPLHVVPTEKMVKPSEAASLLGVHHNTVLAWIRQEKVPYVQTPGGHYLLPWSLLVQALGGTYDVSLSASASASELAEEEASELARR